MRAKEAMLATGSPSVGIVAFDGLSLFEFAVACEVFRPQSWLEPGAAWYRMRVCSAGASAVRLRHDLRMDVPNDLSTLAGCHTVVVPPCDDPEGVPAEVVDAIKAAHANGARLVSLCTGVFILAAAGLLDGRRVTTHWDECPRLIRDYAGRLEVDPDVLYVDDGDILTSAGSAASIDLCLHIVRNDYGADVASRLARDLVVPPYRDGGQAQYIATPLPDPSTSDLFVDTVAWVQEHLGDPVSINDLARRSAMSRRTFARRFLETTGTTPYRWLLRQRLQFAQRLLETTDLPVDAIAERSGFINAGNLRKHFSRSVKNSPHGYRRTFQSAGR